MCIKIRPKVDAEFLQQLCAEQLVTRRNRNGFAVREWQKIRERNEGLDCFVYARAAAAAAGLDRFEDRHWREMEKQLGIAAPPESPDTTEAAHEQRFGGDINISGSHTAPRRVVHSRWMR